MNQDNIWKGQRALWLIVLMALVSTGAIVGMLLTDSVWDWILLLFAAAPLAVGAKRARVVARSDTAGTRGFGQHAHEPDA